MMKRVSNLPLVHHEVGEAVPKPVQDHSHWLLHDPHDPLPKVRGRHVSDVTNCGGVRGHLPSASPVLNHGSPHGTPQREATSGFVASDQVLGRDGAEMTIRFS